MVTFRHSAALIAVAAALVAAGCGDDSDSDSGPLTRAEFVTQADKLCKEASTASAKAAGGSDVDALLNQGPEAYAKAAELLEKYTDAADPFFDKLKALQPPEADRALVGRWLNPSLDNVEQTRDLAAALRKNDTSALQRIVAKLNANRKTFTAASKEIGFKTCGTTAT